jgi:imidazolonepropionase-like amidohydrolase
MISREKEWGTVEKGKLADLVILDANSLDDIRNIRYIYRVIKSGVAYDPMELLKLKAK